MEGTTLKNWCIGKKLGGGACGDVFEVSSLVPIKGSPASGYVIKVAPLPTTAKTKKGKEQLRSANSLYAEYMIYTKLFKSKGIAYLPLNAYGEANKYRYIVMERLGRTLGDVTIKEGPVPQHTTARIGYDIVQSVEQIHAKNIVYVDIKPDNFMISSGVEDQVYCLDFGICDTYMNPVKRIHKPQVFGAVVGTPAFLSVDCHQGSNASRRDDLEAILYVLIYMMKGTLPWINAKSDQEGAIIKKETPIMKLCIGLNPIWGNMLETVRGYSFEEKPNYEWFTNQLKLMVTETNGPYQWK